MLGYFSRCSAGRYWVDELGVEYRLDKIIGDFAASLEDRRGFRPVLRELIVAYISQPPPPLHYCCLKVAFFSELTTWQGIVFQIRLYNFIGAKWSTG